MPKEKAAPKDTACPGRYGLKEVGRPDWLPVRRVCPSAAPPPEAHKLKMLSLLYGGLSVLVVIFYLRVFHFFYSLRLCGMFYNVGGLPGHARLSRGPSSLSPSRWFVKDRCCWFLGVWGTLKKSSFGYTQDTLSVARLSTIILNFF